MNPGPKPIAPARLKHYAWVAAKLLFLLRDGQDGMLIHEDEALFTIKPIKRIPVTCTTVEIEAAWKELKPPKVGFFAIEPPLNPAPPLWAALKRARSEREIKDVADKVAEWGPGYKAEYDFPAVLRLHARTILKAKQLPEYPKSKRAKSDDKRIWFFAKLLAGLTLGRSPLYTLKRLSRWHGEPYPTLKRSSHETQHRS